MEVQYTILINIIFLMFISRFLRYLDDVKDGDDDEG